MVQISMWTTTITLIKTVEFVFCFCHYGYALIVCIICLCIDVSKMDIHNKIIALYIASRTQFKRND